MTRSSTILTQRFGWLGACVGIYLVVTTAGCGSSGDYTSREPSVPRTPVTATVSVASNTLREGALEETDVWVDLSPQVERSNWVRLDFEGAASLGVDFEIDDQTLYFNPNQTRASTKIRALDDWLPEGAETLTIRLSEFSDATSAGVPSNVSLTIEDDADTSFTKADKRGFADLYLSVNASFTQADASLELRVLNWGALDASATTMRGAVFSLTEPGRLGTAVVRFADIEVPPIERRNSFKASISTSLSNFQPEATYWVWIEVDAVPEEDDFGRLPNRDYIGFTLDSRGEILASCTEPDRARPTETDDPLFSHQWPLRNEGQPAFADNGGVRGADLQMASVLQDGSPTGKGVNVAVVDTGLEICHPDLAANVVAGGSYNFKTHAAATERWYNAVAEDPFFPDSRGDHGTSVAGVIGAVANNGLGLRGVAPDAQLFGFNYLSEQCCEEDALGGSSAAPNSEQIHVFNMSYGTLGSQYNDPDDSIFKYGTESLRDGLGAIYVKGAGNGFRRCINFEHQAHAIFGCTSASGDGTNNLPYLIVVGAFSADGNRSSYSSAGSNLWISAPAGEYGVNEPATITTDQYGIERGYSSRGYPGLSLDRNADPHGDYYSNFNGTSSATPHVSGVVALMLEEAPNLTWRDVKHILASTASRPQMAFVPNSDVQVVIGEQSAVLYRDWITNAAGYSFHNYFGFGTVDVDAAIEMIRDSFQPDNLGSQQQSGWLTSSLDGLQIPDHEGAGISRSRSVDLGSNANIEAVQLRIAGSHENLADLSIELTSPAGTSSILNPAFNQVLSGSSTLDWQLLSNAFYGEDPNGTWTLRVIDAAVEDTGSLDYWALRFWHGEHP